MKKSNIGQYGLGTPERVLTEFLTSWQNQDWKGMELSCQLTWLKNELQSTQWIEDYFIQKKLITFKIRHSRNISDMFTIIQVRTEIRNNNRKITEDLQVNLIKESAPYNPDINGNWGVNPISALKVIRRK